MNSSAPATAPAVHHFGLVVKNIEAHLQDSIWELDGPIAADPLQMARLCMVRLKGQAGRSLVELIEPTDAKSPTYRFVKASPVWHHVCLEFENIPAADHFAEEAFFIPVTPWKPAILFGGRSVRFFYSRQRELIELLA